MDFTSLTIVLFVVGAAGGNALGSLAKSLSLGAVGNTLAGAVGGFMAGLLLPAIIPMLYVSPLGSLDIGFVIGQVVGGGVGGAVLTATVGAIKNSMAKA